jgi:hypothetical protein
MNVTSHGKHNRLPGIIIGERHAASSILAQAKTASVTISRFMDDGCRDETDGGNKGVPVFPVLAGGGVEF